MGFSFKSYFDGLVGLVYPDLCMACVKDSPIKGDDFCVNCFADLPFTTHMEIEDNDFKYHFYGRVPIVHGAALLNFYKENMVNTMLHRLKYDRKKRVGERLGIMLAKKLEASPYFKTIDLIIPVPIHLKKKIKRGYNQSGVIANAISKELNIPVIHDVLVKEKETLTQTQKTRSQRTLDLLDTLALKKSEKLIGKHILIVDDVMTTGATLEACVLRLQEIKDITFSLATLAITKTI